MTLRRTIPVLLYALSCGLLPAPAQETEGRADIALQGYQLLNNGRRAFNTAGFQGRFHQYLDNLGYLSGNLETYGSSGAFRTGETFLELTGPVFWNHRLTFTGGDFRIAMGNRELPTGNLYYPDLWLRGFQIQAARPTRTWRLFGGVESLPDGPRVPYRRMLPQSALGLSLDQKLGEKLTLNLRLMRLWSSPASLLANPQYFSLNRAFSSSTSATAQALWKPSPHLKVFGETALTQTTLVEPGAALQSPYSALAGVAYDRERIGLRANYIYQPNSYLPILGFFSGNRRGPYVEARVRPLRGVDLYASAYDNRSNLERDPAQPTFSSRGETAGAGFEIPLLFQVSAQLSKARFISERPSAVPPSGSSYLPQDSSNTQWSISLSRNIHRHNLRVTYRELDLLWNGARTINRAREAEDLFTYKNVLLGGGIRYNSLVNAGEIRHSLYYRGNAQLRVRQVTAFGSVEFGEDLLNRTLFSTNTIRTTVFGASFPVVQGWDFQIEGFRNSLAMLLNPESAFFLAGQGIGVTNVLGGLNQWSLFFRLQRSFLWGKPLDTSSLRDYAGEQRPITGSVEGVVAVRTRRGPLPTAGVPVTLDGSRVARTDAQGRYIFADVAEGRHALALSATELPAEYEPATTTALEVAVQAGRPTRVDFGLKRLWQIGGRVSLADALPENFTIDRIVVRLLPGARYTTPNEAGEFFFYNLEEGDYEVRIETERLPAGVELLTFPVLPVSVPSPDNAAAPLEFRLAAPVKSKPIRRVLNP